MAAAQKLYPRATIKRTIKAHSKKGISKNADILVFLDYTLFIRDLMREAAIQTKKSGEKGVSARSIHKVTEDSLRRFKG